MYTNNPITPPIVLFTGPHHSATLRSPWWTIPEAQRQCMHAFTNSSNKLRHTARNATLRSSHHTSLYKFLILRGKAQGARTNTVGMALHFYIRKFPKDGIPLLKFIYIYISPKPLINCVLQCATQLSEIYTIPPSTHALYSK